jgi:hypothetical protein
LGVLDWIFGRSSGINCVTFYEIAGQNLKEPFLAILFLSERFGTKRRLERLHQEQMADEPGERTIADIECSR